MRIWGKDLVTFTETWTVRTLAKRHILWTITSEDTPSDVSATGNMIEQQEVGRCGTALIQQPTRERKEKKMAPSSAKNGLGRTKVLFSSF